MIGLYLACLLFGAILLGASLALGGKDTESLAHGHEIADHEAPEHEAPDADGEPGDHGDHAHDHDARTELAHGPSAWYTLLSMRFWTYTIGSFGAIGLLLTLFGLGPILGLLVAGAGSLAIGGAIASLFRWFAREQVSADVGVAGLIGQEAKVMLPIRPGGIGKIAIHTSSGREEMMAKSQDGGTLEPGQVVLVAHIEGGIADVTAMPSTRPRGKTRETA